MTIKDVAGNQPPKHVAIIMDGNGRWAKARGLGRFYGHVQGVESVRTVLRAAVDHGVEYLTIYAFSTENWGRPKEEVDGLMELFCKCTVNEIPELKEQGVRVIFIGDKGGLSDEVQRSIDYCSSETEHNSRLTLAIAINYSSRVEIAHAAGIIAAKVASGEMSPEDVTPSVISDNLYTKNIPDPDLVIRTSGEHRLSNFLMWQCAYSEFYFTDILWPDFGEDEFKKAIEDYKQRTRRFGLV